MGTHSQMWAAAHNPAQIPFTPNGPLRAKLGEKVTEPEFREEQRPAPPSQQQDCRGTAGSSLQREPPWFPRLGELPIEQTRASISRQNCRPSRNNWNLKGKAESVQAVETNSGNKSLWHEKKGKETGRKATLRSRVWLQGQQKGEVDGAKKRTKRPQFPQSVSSHHLLQPWHLPWALSTGSMVAPGSLSEGRSLTSAPAVIQGRSIHYSCLLYITFILR